MTLRKEHSMNKFGTLMLVASATLLYGCSSTTPNELVDARRAYEEASMGPAAQWAPAELHDAKQALAQAEKAFEKDSNSFRTVDLAYVAERKAAMAEAQASILMEQAGKADSNTQYTDSQRKLLADQKTELGKVRTNLALAEQSEANLSSRLSDGQEAKREADGQEAKRRADSSSEKAEEEISKIGEIEDDDRGTVISLPASILFRGNETYLMPGAEDRLDLVVAAIGATSDRNVVVEGHSDSEGSEAANSNLTQVRADAIRDYLIRSGCPAGLVQARGMGEGSPLGDNATTRGRSENRRFEIIIERAGK